MDREAIESNEYRFDDELYDKQTKTKLTRKNGMNHSFLHNYRLEDFDEADAAK
jgi:hypothetical protein